MALSHGPPIVTNGLVLALDAADRNSYPGSGTAWTDLSGNGNNGTLTNGPTYNSVNGGSLVFDGVDDYVVSSNSSSLQLTSQGTVSAWVYLTDILTDERLIVMKGNLSGNGISYGLYFNYSPSSPNNIAFFVDSDGNWGPTSIITKENISANTWYNFVAGWSSSGLFLYTNGVLSNSNSTSVSANVNSFPLYVGGGPDIGWIDWKGNIAQVSIYNRALSAAEIQQNFNALRGRFNI
jgi:hypothetical protein